MTSGPTGRDPSAEIRAVVGRCAALDAVPIGERARLADWCAAHIARKGIAGDRTVREVARYAAEQLERVQNSPRRRTDAAAARYFATTFANALGRPEAVPEHADPGMDWAAENKQIARTLRDAAEFAEREAAVRAAALPKPEAAQRLAAARAQLHRPDFDRDAPVGVVRVPLSPRRRVRGMDLPKRGPGTVVDGLADALETQGHFFVPPVGAHLEEP